MVSLMQKLVATKEWTAACADRDWTSIALFGDDYKAYVDSENARIEAILKDLGTPLVIHQPSYNILNRWVETDGLKDTLAELGVADAQYRLAIMFQNGLGGAR